MSSIRPEPDEQERDMWQIPELERKRGLERVEEARRILGTVKQRQKKAS